MIRHYFDTSVLLPALVSAHPQHKASLQLMDNALSSGVGVTSVTHTYAELYSNLTKLPKGLAIPPDLAFQLITKEIGAIFEIVELARSDYEAALHRCAQKGLVSGVIYDALHLQAALKAEVSVLYTNNFSDFERLLDPADKIELKAVP
ncbi:MAG: type II toxin-antitoxin system VapC family toxin [Planctomycetota bacterium]|jgi:predicted nucleic acid-binding protein